jgi:hypothetical protein
MSQIPISISYKGRNFKLVMVQVKKFEYIQRSMNLNISLIIWRYLN